MEKKGSVREDNDAVTIFFSKDGMAFPIGTAVVQANPDRLRDDLQRMIHGNPLHNVPGSESDLLVVRSMGMDQK